MAAAMQGLFGPGADEVRQAIAAQGQQQDMAYAQMPAGRGPVALMAAAGRGAADVVNGISGRVDPRVAKAQAMQEAAQEVDSAGYSLMDDSQSYYKAAYSALMKRGLTQEAAHVRDLALNESSIQADTKLKNAQAEETLKNIGKDTWKPLGKDGKYLVNTRDGTIKKNDQWSGAGNFKADNVLNVGPAGLTPGAKGTYTIDMNREDSEKLLEKAIQNGDIVYGKPTTPQSTNINLPPQIRSFGQEVGKQSATDTYTQYKNARDIPIAVNKANQIITALDDPNLIVGPGADARLAIAKGLNIVGADNEETITNTQSLVSDLADATLSAIGTSGLGTGQGFTEKDKQMLQDARAGRIPMTKETLRNVASKAIEAQKWTAIKWNEQLGDFNEETKAQLRSVGINTDPVEVPRVPKPKKYPSKEQIINNVPPDWKPEIWNVLTDEQKAQVWKMRKDGR